MGHELRPRRLLSGQSTHLPALEFHRCVRRYGGDQRHRGFPCLDQFLAIAFAQLTARESLRDVEACLRPCDSRDNLLDSANQLVLFDL
jgi:hypothetical protein